jgi:O-antigen ligase
MRGDLYHLKWLVNTTGGSQNMSASALGVLIGSIVLTGLISRILDKYAFKAQAPIKKALLVSLITIAICTVLGSFSFGLVRAFLQYGIGTIVWLIYDLIRAKRAKQ